MALLNKFLQIFLNLIVSIIHNDFELDSYHNPTQTLQAQKRLLSDIIRSQKKNGS